MLKLWSYDESTKLYTIIDTDINKGVRVTDKLVGLIIANGVRIEGIKLKDFNLTDTVIDYKIPKRASVFCDSCGAEVNDFTAIINNVCPHCGENITKHYSIDTVTSNQYDIKETKHGFVVKDSVTKQELAVFDTEEEAKEWLDSDGMIQDVLYNRSKTKDFNYLEAYTVADDETQTDIFCNTEWQVLTDDNPPDDMSLSIQNSTARLNFGDYNDEDLKDYTLSDLSTYLDSTQIRLIQEYYLNLSKDIFKQGCANKELKPAKDAKLKELRAKFGDPTDTWDYIGVIDLGYTGTTVCPYCGCKTDFTAVCASCNQPLIWIKKDGKPYQTKGANAKTVNGTRAEYIYYSIDKPWTGWISSLEKSEVDNLYYWSRFTNGFSPARTINGYCNTIEGNENGLKPCKMANKVVKIPDGDVSSHADGRVACGFCHHLIPKSHHYSVSGTPLRHMHLAGNVTKNPNVMNDFYSDLESGDYTILEAIEKHNLIYFGITDVSDFFDITEDQLRALKSAQQYSGRDIAKLYVLYNRNNGDVTNLIKEFDNLTEIIARFRLNFAMFKLMHKSSMMLHSTMLSYYEKFKKEGVLFPETLVKDFRNTILGWDLSFRKHNKDAINKIYDFSFKVNKEYRNVYRDDVVKQFTEFINIVLGKKYPQEAVDLLFERDLNYIINYFKYNLCGCYEYDGKFNKDEGGKGQEGNRHKYYGDKSEFNLKVLKEKLDSCAKYAEIFEAIELPDTRGFNYELTYSIKTFNRRLSSEALESSHLDIDKQTLNNLVNKHKDQLKIPYLEGKHFLDTSLTVDDFIIKQMERILSMIEESYVKYDIDYVSEDNYLETVEIKVPYIRSSYYSSKYPFDELYKKLYVLKTRSYSRGYMINYFEHHDTSDLGKILATYKSALEGSAISDNLAIDKYELLDWGIENKEEIRKYVNSITNLHKRISEFLKELYTQYQIIDNINFRNSYDLYTEIGKLKDAHILLEVDGPSDTYTQLKAEILRKEEEKKAAEEEKRKAEEEVKQKAEKLNAERQAIKDRAAKEVTDEISARNFLKSIDYTNLEWVKHDKDNFKYNILESVLAYDDTKKMSPKQAPFFLRCYKVIVGDDYKGKALGDQPTKKKLSDFGQNVESALDFVLANTQLIQDFLDRHNSDGYIESRCSGANASKWSGIFSSIKKYKTVSEAQEKYLLYVEDIKEGR